MTQDEELSDNAIARQAYSELFISCQIEGCGDIFDECLKNPASDPVEKWANEVSLKAMRTGWSVDDFGRVVCPAHSHR